ncbi:ATPase [Pasteurellaceae bacterium 15-036681]|nr:ATPase [Pasteurellaceae bacterium 15-036681]
MNLAKQYIVNGNVSIGIEFGSTRIKAVLIDPVGKLLAVGGFNWENQLVDGFWTYSQQDIWNGLQKAYQALNQDVQTKYGIFIHQAQGIGISGMMHGYIPFDSSDQQLVPFRTWRNNTTEQATKILTKQFNYNIPQRWSIAHLYQAILNQETHLSQINYFTTLAGYIHWQLTGEKVMGVGEASGMFPIDIQSQTYDQQMLAQFEELIKEYQFPWTLSDILPKVLTAGECAGYLTEKGARLLDPSGHLQSGIPFCPPEGDAGTGMVATNSVKVKTGNISAGTSAFAMIVLEKELSKVYEQLDMVTTPSGKLVAMAHANNCTTDINAWIHLFSECLASFGVEHSIDQVYETLFSKALEGDFDCGSLLPYGFHSGEHNLGLSEGCPLFIHPTNSKFNLANFVRSHLYSAFGAMKLGMDILMKEEKVSIEQILAHGGIFKTKNVAAKVLASALNVPIATMDTASEGGAWGIALLANYLNHHKEYSLEEYLEQIVFQNSHIQLDEPDLLMVEGYQQFILNYQKNIPVAAQAIAIQRTLHS